jgi:serine/threonine protein kinase
MSSMIGREIGIYRITDRLGQGGMGVVFKAVDINLDRVVAIKLLNSDVAEMPELVQRFHSEARVQATLSHPNLTTLFAFLLWEGRPVMVMEFIEGETFQSMIARRGPIPASVTIPMFRQALQGVGAAHHRGIVHRDIKPANIMLNRDGLVKVMDFGIAKVLGDTSTTRTNMQMGTSWYMSPEQIMTNSVDARSDIYSLGVTLYEMLAGQLPFQGDSDYAVQMAHLERTPEPPTVHYPHIPPHIVAATMRSLAKKPEERFASVEEFVAALEGGTQTLADSAIRTQPVAAPPPPPLVNTLPPYIPHQFTQPPITRAPSPKPGFPKGVLIGGASAAVVLIAGGLFYANSVSRQHEVERESVVVQRQEAETRRQDTTRLQRDAETKAEAQRTAQTLTDRVKQEQEAAETQSQEQSRADALAAQKLAAQKATAPQAAQRTAAQTPTVQSHNVAPAIQPATNEQLNGIWKGTYLCAQGQTAMQLRIAGSPQGISAAFAFAVPNSKPGTYLMSGSFNPANRQLLLQFVRWGVQPPNYSPANLAGTVDLDRGVISGNVLAPGCSTFVVRR